MPDTEITDAVFSDEEITAFLAMESGVKRAAALALETIATNEALVLKVLQRLDVKTDGAKLAETLMKRCALLRGQAAATEDPDWDGLEVVELVTNDFGARQYAYNDILRSGG